MSDALTAHDARTYEDEARLASRSASMVLANPLTSLGDIRAALVTVQRALDDVLRVSEARKRQLDRLTDVPAQHPN